MYQHFDILFVFSANLVGTISPLQVILALIQENQAFRFLPENSAVRRKYARGVYDAFVPSHRWSRRNSVKRGVLLFQQALEAISRD